jgi:small conductance mechanosensitive channel
VLNGILVAAQPDCAKDAGTWCGQVWNVTHNAWLAGSANWLVAKPLHIGGVLLVAIIVRLMAHRLTDRLTVSKETDGNRRPTILRPLRERNSLAAFVVSERRTQRAKTIGSVLKSIISFVVWGLASVLILGDLGFNLTPIIASAGVVGVAVGFGAQNLVKDFLSGIFMLLEDQYGVGDIVDLGSAKGTVESVGLRVTTVRDYMGTVWYVRNGEVQRVGNSSQGYAVAVVDLPIGHLSDVNRALELLEEVAATAAAQDETLAEDLIEPPKVLGVQKIASDAVSLRLTAKVRPGRRGVAQRELRRRVMAVFDDAGIRPPESGNGSNSGA